MIITGFRPKDIFLKDNSCWLKKMFLSGVCRLKSNTGCQASDTAIFHKNNKNTLLKIILKVSFFLVLATFILIICFLPFIFNIESAQALPSTPFTSPLGGDFIVKFRQEYLDESELVTRKHTGVDIVGGPGDKVRAAGNGVVAYTGFSAIGGRTVVIKHNDKIRSTYLNILDCFVTKGDLLSRGDIIASIGADDDPSFKGPHLHFGIIYVDSYLDPEDVLNIDYASVSRFISLEYINPDVSMQINRK